MSATEWFRENLEARRIEKGMTRSALAKAAGTYPANITRIFQGTEDLTLERAERLANAVDTNLFVLLTPPYEKISS